MRLTVETGPLAGTVVTLERDQPTTLGSGADCALRIREAGVAEHQAVVKALKGEGFGIKALAFGLRLNGTEVEASPLSDGDVIEIGTTRIAYGETQGSGLPNISGYRILDVLGKGGMGIVYRAEQVSLHRQVALKVLDTQQTRNPGFVAKFVAEARAAAKLQHPNVVSVFDVEHDGDLYFYSMELMHEGSCEDWLKQRGAMPVDRALQVIADAAAGLAYAESLGIVHRDIKPDNLMLDQHGAVKIADLGLASQAEGGDARAIGTPHFMAPEQVLNKDIDHRTDLYALGCTFYRLVTGKTPFRGQTVKDILRAQVKDDPEPVSKANPEVPAEVGAIIQRLMQKEPGQRFQTANDLLEELEVLLQPQQKRGLWIGLAAVAVLVAGGAIYWAVNKEKEVVTKEVRYDDPEKQEFADRIEELEALDRLRLATIALLQARLSGKVDEELALALDRVAAEHDGTPAAAEAAQRAAAIRRDVAERARQLELRRERIAEHLAAVRRAIMPPLDAFDFVNALRALDARPADELIDDAELVTGIDKLRAEVLTKAQQRLQQLRDPVAAARAAADRATLATAIETLAVGLEPATRWPAAMSGELSAAREDLTAAQTALQELRRQLVADVWQHFEQLLQASDGFRRHVNRLDFPKAAELLDAFAREASAKEVAARAAGLSAVARHAQTFAQSLAAAAATGELHLQLGEQDMQVMNFDQAAGQFMLHDASKRNPKDELHPFDKLALEQWQSLADQVPAVAETAPPAGSRECFLGLLALQFHTGAVISFLQRLDASDDESGTGDDAYPYSAELFDGLLRDVPTTTETAWAPTLRDELQAGMRLAAGLRALSERRNLAAAGHLDKLFAEHPHSFLVAVLP